jgi:hypothetical protein
VNDACGATIATEKMMAREKAINDDSFAFIDRSLIMLLPSWEG